MSVYFASPENIQSHVQYTMTCARCIHSIIFNAHEVSRDARVRFHHHQAPRTIMLSE